MGPDAFIGDWYGYATNQLGHFMVGVVAFFIVVLFSKAVRYSAIVVLVIYSVWEIAQLFIGGMLWDGIEDFAYVALGVLFAAAAWVAKREYMLLSLILTIVALINGVVGRKNERKRK